MGQFDWTCDALRGARPSNVKSTTFLWHRMQQLFIGHVGHFLSFFVKFAQKGPYDTSWAYGGAMGT